MMRSSGLSAELEDVLHEYMEAAGRVLRADVSAGAEVELELSVRRGRARTGASFYSYTPLTDAFIRERQSVLERLPEHGPAVDALTGFDGLDRYLAGWGGPQDLRDEDLLAKASVSAGARARACAALHGLTGEIFAEQTEFELRPERFARALARLERAEPRSAPDTVTLVATLRGLTIASAEVQLTRGLTLALPAALGWAPQAAIAGEDGADLNRGDARGGDAGAGEHLLIALVCEHSFPSAASEDAPACGASGDRLLDAIAQGRALLSDLLRALRLFGDGRVTLGPIAWARSGDEGRWSTVALGHGGRPHGMLVVTPEQEDELRAFCNLVSRRAPDREELAWALRRYELGCERGSAYEGLSDHLLALRALLEPEGPASCLLAGRVAALCATPEKRAKLTERMTKAQALERAFVAGKAGERAPSLALVRDVAEHLRALLRDVICGHLSPDLARLADELLSAQAVEASAASEDPAAPAKTSPAAAGQHQSPPAAASERKRRRRRRSADAVPADATATRHARVEQAPAGEQMLIEV